MEQIQITISEKFTPENLRDLMIAGRHCIKAHDSAIKAIGRWLEYVGRKNLAELRTEIATLNSSL